MVPIETKMLKILRIYINVLKDSVASMFYKLNINSDNHIIVRQNKNTSILSYNISNAVQKC